MSQNKNTKADAPFSEERLIFPNKEVANSFRPECNGECVFSKDVAPEQVLVENRVRY